MTYADYFTNDNAEDKDIDNKKKVSMSPSLDKNFKRITRKLVDKDLMLKKSDGKTYYKKYNIGLYSTNSTGSKIRNAVTGHRYNYLVGSKEQDLLFAVGLCTGETGTQESLSLFYDSPEQYENHMFASLDITRKMQWYSKNLPKV